MNKTPVTMPLLSDTMQTGRLARWLKQPGDAIKTGDVLAEVESDKAIMDVEAYNDGYLVGPLAPVNTDIPVKSNIAWIADEPAVAEAAPQAAAPAK
ncbi:lipoyl domain-containing protein, partial [Acidithiobacillus sp.]|uniref:lipoyl domain-containing protein n=1 Tax=Acidithiobacillus sp. TaxID=1872118 RepID=UPI0025BE789E